MLVRGGQIKLEFLVALWRALLHPQLGVEPAGRGIKSGSIDDIFICGEKMT